MSGVNRWSAPAGDYAKAVRLGVGLCAAALLITPIAGIELGAAHSLLAMLLAASTMGLGITALLLLIHARTMHSLPVAVLGSGFLFATFTMVPYAFLNPALFPGVGTAIGADPIGYKYLWFSWRIALLVSMLAYQRLRYTEVTRRSTRVNGRSVIIGLAVAFVIVTALAIWVPDLPTLSDGGHVSLLFSLVLAPVTIVLALGVVIEAIRRRRHASVLDAWIAVAAFSVIVEAYLTVVGMGTFTVGWWAARVVLLFFTAMMLTVLLAQAARLYADLIARAQELESEAHTDTLSGLPNRRRFDEEFSRAFGSAIRRASPIAVAIIDIDRFKLYNDTFGHQAGDVALARIAAAIAESVERSGDFAARYGGEEFVVILEDTTIGGAAAVAERIRIAVLEAAIQSPDGAPLSVSAGVAARLPGSSREALLRQADAALYEAKNGGRNRIAIWNSAAIAPIGSAFEDPTIFP